MKKLIPTLLFLIVLSSGCQKMYPDVDVTKSQQTSKVAGAGPVISASTFMVNGESYDAVYMGQSIATHRQFWFQSYDNGGGTLTLNIKDPLPTADGIYIYQLDRDISQPNNMQVSCQLNSLLQSFELFGPSGQSATVKVHGGMVSVLIPDVVLESLDGPVNAITVSAVLILSRPSGDDHSSETEVNAQ